MMNILCVATYLIQSRLPFCTTYMIVHTCCVLDWRERGNYGWTMCLFTYLPPPHTHTYTRTLNVAHLCTEQQKSVKATRAETGTDSTPETSQILKQLGLLPSTSHVQSSQSSSHVSEPTEQIDNMRPVPEPEKETEEKKEDNGNIDDSAFLPSERPVQKNKKKCWMCKTKLELAQRALGGCKCGKYVHYVCVCMCSVVWSYNHVYTVFSPSKNLVMLARHNFGATLREKSVLKVFRADNMLYVFTGRTLRI